MIKCKHYKSSYNSFGLILSRDCVLQQFEPYEVVKYWEPYLTIFFGKHQLRICCKIPSHSWLGRKWNTARTVTLAAVTLLMTAWPALAWLVV